MSERLKLLRKEIGLSQDDFGKAINLSRSHISSLENGSRELTERIISDIRREFNVNENWLRHGTGEMFVQAHTFSLDEKAKKNNLSELEIDIMQSYMELDRNTRTDIIAWIKGNFDKHAQIETAASIEDSIDDEVEKYRAELKAEKKGAILSASEEERSKSS